MNVLVASDSFKGSLSSIEVGECVKKGILRAIPDAEVVISPMADGGEGTIDALLHDSEGWKVEVEVHGPLMDKILTQYAVMKDHIVFIECAKSSGLPLVPLELRNPMVTNTYGFGEQIKDAIGKGYRHFILSLGGSATNDGGIGMLQALGWEFFDDKGALLYHEGNPLLKVASISDGNVLPEIEECTFIAASDVTHPFFGPNGAAHIFAKQKGANERQILELDAALSRFADLIETSYGVRVQEIAGAGAAGGLGGAIVGPLKGSIQSGVELVMEVTAIKEKIKSADVLITGEGSLDNQSIMGKVPFGIAKLAKEYGKPVIGIAGRIDTDLKEVNNYFNGVFSIQTECRSLEEALDPHVSRLQLEITAEQITRVMMLKGEMSF
ncbi:glycerate kinase [Bacillus sp. es.034]|jgi:glycerate 2-kinase|uniref:glycerate kinase family protein n=1 Tax=Bacillus sp. es.034 TaxID=1761763 RepID=UPI000BF9F3EF|nr:glycerate kinase [Bacillus sp. es.034]PFG03365.1 glycerate kinase [Bacillus sp. es.034]